MERPKPYFTHTFPSAYYMVEHYHNANAAHIKSGRKLQHESNESILKFAAGELVELSIACGSTEVQSRAQILEELADTLLCLFHFGVVQEFTSEVIAREMKRKLELRFQLPKE